MGVKKPVTKKLEIGGYTPQLLLRDTLTSFWSNHQAILTTFRIDKNTGELTKLPCCTTGGLQACHGIFSSDGTTYTGCHHNDGRVTFFDASKDEGVTQYLRVIRVPN